MIRRTLLFAIIFLFAIAAPAQTPAPQAAQLSFSIAAGVLSPSGTFSGSYVVDSVTGMISTGQIVATIGTATYTFAGSGMYVTPGLLWLYDSGGDSFLLALNGAPASMVLNTPANMGTSDAFLSLAGVRYDVTGGTVSQPVTTSPPPPPVTTPPTTMPPGATITIAMPVDPTGAWSIGLVNFNFLPGLVPDVTYTFTCSAPVSAPTPATASTAPVPAPN